jgi:hypothetical protein
VLPTSWEKGILGQARRRRWDEAQSGREGAPLAGEAVQRMGCQLFLASVGVVG